MNNPTKTLGGIAVLATITLALAACSPSSAGSAGPAGPTDDSLSAVQKAGTLTVGTEGTYRPFSFHEGGSGELTGYDVEVIKAVGAELGVEVAFEETQWDAIFAGLQAGRFDVIAN